MKPEISGFLLALLIATGCGRAESRVVIRFIDQPDVAGAWKEIIDRFERAHPGIDVELVEGPAATNTREDLYAASFLSGDGAYDLVYMDVIWVPKFAAKGWLAPLDDRFAPEEREDFLPGDLRGSTFEGRIFRVPMRSDAGILYYRTDLVSEAPQTFDDLVKMARRSQDPPKRWGLVFQGRQYEGLVCAFLEILWGHGGDVLDERGEVVLDSPEAVRALEWMKKTVGDIAPEGVTTYQEEEARHAFQEGRAVFMRNWPYAWSRIGRSDSLVRGKVGLAPMPHAPGRESAAALGGWGFGLASTGRHPEAAWAFVRFATAAEQQKAFHLRNGALPSRRSLFRDPEILEGSPHYSELYEVLLRARPRPMHPRYAEISDALQAQVSGVLAGGRDPAEALSAAADKIRLILRR